MSAATGDIDLARAEVRFDPVHGPVERWAAHSPRTLAARFGGQSLTYAELNRRANRLARHLRALGVGEEVCVGVLMERSLDLPVALLAVLKAGGAFVPLDPTYPEERLAFMLADTDARVVLTQSWLRERMPAGGHHVECVCVDTAWEALAELATTDLDIEVKGGQLAYIIYTSGSTGRPKGVEVLHRGLANHTAWLRKTIGFGPEDRILQCNSISFDGTLVEFFGPLQSGAAVVLAAPGRQSDMPYLAALIAREQVTLLNCVPSLLRGLLSEPSLVAGRLRYVACGGEALAAELARRLREVVPHVRLGNYYGPTETTLNATYFEVPEELPSDAMVPIGRPIDNAWCEVLDAEGRRAPPGAIGELYIGGVGVSRGYRNQPRLTAERFIEHPLHPGVRMYRTGDRVLQRADGQLHFIGRTDTQVKVRGYRIELSEVETALAAIDGVAECAVVLREDAPGEPRLVAYAAGDGVTAGVLREALRQRLPGHMVPTAIVVLPQLPLLASGKIDRGRLPAPSRESLDGRAFEAPRGEVEQEVAGIWQSLLGLEQVGRDDHFFELGGHSLLLVAMLRRLRERGLAADTRMVFDNPTLAGLCAAMAASQQAAAAAAPAASAPEGGATPAMSPLHDLDARDLARIVADVPGGAVNIQDIYPLLPLQEGMLFHHRLQEQGDAYLSRRLFAFDSNERADRFLAALQQVIDRHDAYRTAICWRGLSRPVQVVLRRAPLPVSRLPDVGRLLAQTDPLARRMELGEAPLFAAFVADHPAGDGCTLALLSHHIVNDHVSEGVLWDEVAAILADSPERLCEPVPFRTFVDQALSRDASDAKAYFTRELGDLSEPTTPFGLVDVRQGGHQASEARIRLEPALCARLSAAACSAGVSVAGLFHVAWAMVLARCSNADDIVFGTVLSGRLAAGGEAGRCVGLLMNTLPLRIRLARRSVRRVVASVHAQLAELVAHEHASLALAQSCSGVHSSSPLFNTLLNYRRGHVGGFDPDSGGARHPGLAGITRLSAEERTNYPIHLAVDHATDGVAITARCVAGADPARIAAYAATAIGALVSALEAGGGDDIASLDVLPGDEHRRLVVDFNATGRPAGRTGRVVDQIAARMARHPDAPALRFDDERMSYRELCARVDRAACVLRSRGVGRGSRVGVCLPRGTGMVVALLAILRAGGAYVPLDPDYPRARLAYMAGDAALDLVVDVPGQWGALLPERSLPLAELVADGEGRTDVAWKPDPERDARDEDPAYVIYTSGSTGTPKGVVVPHRALENFIAGMASEPGLDASDRLLAVTTLGFDIAALELLLPLCVGAEVVIASREVAWDGRALRRLLESSRATVMQATPATWRLLVEAGWQGGPHFRALVGGETLADDLATHLLARSRETWNLYGPTETTVWSSCWQVGPGRAMSIGRPIANTRIHVLDAHMRPCPLDVEGEIYIGGAGLSLGYHDRPELTAQRFVDDPFEPGARLYRTGDRGRWCGDGLLEHLGRLDFQVKLRGHRIEPGEIEARLRAHPQVADAVVVVREDTPGDPRLVAYVVPAPDAPDANALRAHLRATLPEYMVPGHMRFLTELPLAPNGKLDRAALPAPDLLDAVAGTHYEPPDGDLERAIADIWMELVGTARVGRNDNFFELGGHSLLAMRAVARIEALAGARLTMLQLATGSLRTLAEQVAASSRPRTTRPPGGLLARGWRRLRATLSGIGRAAWDS